jgi:Flp pilus assembly CpaE family ATPase
MDLSSGIVGFMLKLNNAHSVLEAAEKALELDESLWPQLVSAKGQLDVLHSGPLNPGFRIDNLQIRNILDFARRHYKSICVDLSGNLERYSLEVMHESKQIFLVVTPEIPALHLAREKLAYLQQIDLWDRTYLLLNRSHRRALISNAQIESLLGKPLYAAFANDYNGVHRSLQDGTTLDAVSELGKQFARFAELITQKKPVPELDSRRRFIDYFSILPKNFPEPERRSA